MTDTFIYICHAGILLVLQMRKHMSIWEKYISQIYLFYVQTKSLLQINFNGGISLSLQL